jgi:hypothetical protein
MLPNNNGMGMNPMQTFVGGFNMVAGALGMTPPQQQMGQGQQVGQRPGQMTDDVKFSQELIMGIPEGQAGATGTPQMPQLAGLGGGMPQMGGMGMPGMGGMGMGMPGMGTGMGTIPGMMQPLGGMYGGMNAGGQMNQQQSMQAMMGMMMMMMSMLQMMGNQGQAQQMGGMQNQIPGMGQKPGMAGVGNAQGQQQGGVVELKMNGEEVTTPGGCKVKWHGDGKKESTVDITEPGKGGTQQGGTGSGNKAAGNAAPAAGNAAPEAGNAAPGGKGAGNAAPAGKGSKGESSSGEKKWKVWGDPHIDDAEGKRTDFKKDKKNAMFTLEDGTRMLVTAESANGLTTGVKLFMPGTQITQQNLGVNAADTEVYKNTNGGMGKADSGQTMADELQKFQQNFPNAGFGQGMGMAMPNTVPGMMQGFGM